jgi:eukaryotic-like serine/threonine-protein kinase
MSGEKPLPEGIYAMRELGVGGQARVRLVRRERPDGSKEFQVLKMPKGDEPELRARLKQEFAILTELATPGHRHVIQTLGPCWLPLGAEAGFFLEYIDGGNLAQIVAASLPGAGDASPPAAIPAEPMTFADRLLCCAQAAEALAYVHERKLVHRDFKPSNILVDRTGEQPRAVLSDFGVARHPEVTLNTRCKVGTEPYTAPDLVPGEEQAHHDVFSLGATLWFVFTGQHALLHPETRRHLAQYRHLPALPRGTDSIPNACLDVLNRTIHNTCHTDTRGRWTAKKVAEELRKLHSDHFAPKPMYSEKTVRQISSRLSMAIVLLLAIIASVGYLSWRADGKLNAIEKSLGVKTLPDFDAVMQALSEAAKTYVDGKASDDYRPTFIMDFFGFGDYSFRRYSQVVDGKPIENQRAGPGIGHFGTLKSFLHSHVRKNRLGIYNNRNELIEQQFKSEADLSQEEAAYLMGYLESYKDFDKTEKGKAAITSIQDLINDVKANGIKGNTINKYRHALMQADNAHIESWLQARDDEKDTNQGPREVQPCGMQIFYFQPGKCIVTVADKSGTDVRGFVSTNYDINEHFRLAAKRILGDGK